MLIQYQYQYDAQGNVTGDGENRYRYDCRNRLTEIETKDGGIQRNRYDGEGLRAELEENGELTRFLFSGREVVAEEKEEHTVIRYIRGIELLSSDCESARTYYHYACDELGSVTHVTDASGEVLNRYTYDVFGNRTSIEETVENRFGFTGELLDGLTGQYYLRARFYSPAIGRFLQEDTYYGDGLNLYSYCQNNPVEYMDPSGHNGCPKEGLMEGKNRPESDAGNANTGKKPEGGSGTTPRIIPGQDGVATGGDSTKLGKNMMESMGQKRSTKWTGYQAQHIIPAEMLENPVIQKIGMDLDDASNGLFLPKPSDDVSTLARYSGYHSTYNEFVKTQLDALDISQNSEILQRQVMNLQNKLKKLQQSGLPLYPSKGASMDLWQRSFERLQ